jgi:hypothetical protein
MGLETIRSIVASNPIDTKLKMRMGCEFQNLIF